MIRRHRHPPTVRTGLWILCLVVLAIHVWTVVIPAALNTNTNGFAAYYTASKILRERPRDLPRVYDDAWFQSRIDEFGFRHVKDLLYVQPPTMSLLMAPVAWLPVSIARVVWIALAVIFWLSGSILLYRALSAYSADIHSLLLLLASTTAYVPLRDNLRQGQSYALLFFLLSAHFQLLLRRGTRTPWLAGVPLGGMLILKLAGAWLWPLLLLSRQWRTVTSAAVTCLVIALLCSPVVGWSVWRPFFHELPRLAWDPVRYVSAYQTTTSLFGHLFIYDPAWSPHPIAHWPLLAWLSTIAVTILAIVQSVRYERLRADSLPARALSLGMFGALIVSLTPIAESYHYVLVLPSLIIAWWWAFAGRRGIASCVALAFGTLLLSVPQKWYGAPAIQGGWLAVLAYPRVFGAFVLWTWFVRSLRCLLPADQQIIHES